MKTPKKSYKKYKFSTNCRICLTQSSTAVSLIKLLQDDGPLIFEALGEVMGVQITLDNGLPSKICGMCLGLLKISYQLRVQFMESEQRLQELTCHDKVSKTIKKAYATVDDIYRTEPTKFALKTNDNNTHMSENDVSYSSKREVAPVELLVGTKKYDFSDVVIIEDDSFDRKPASHQFKGFLDNLGKSITAKIVKKKSCLERTDTSKEKRNVEEPKVFIQKVRRSIVTPALNFTPRSDVSINDIIKDIDKFIIEKRSNATYSLDGGVFMAENADLMRPQALELDQQSLKGTKQELDQKQIQSALNLNFKCYYCKKVYSSKNRMMNHLPLCMKTQFTCAICKSDFKNSKILRAHMQVAHSTTLGNKKRYKCNECNLIFKSKGAFSYHNFKHKGKQLICEICGKNYYTKPNLDAHCEAAHQIKKTKVLCPVCGKGFHYQSGLFYHMKLHTNERKYLCDFCDRKFYAMNSLKRHLRTHTGDRPYPCKFCEKMFFSLGEVKKHEFLHTGYRPYHCELCGKGFVSGHNKKLHMLTHTGDLSCSYCDRTFFYMDSLTFHIRSKHPAAIEECNESVGDSNFNKINKFIDRRKRKALNEELNFSYEKDVHFVKEGVESFVAQTPLVDESLLQHEEIDTEDHLLPIVQEEGIQLYATDEEVDVQNVRIDDFVVAQSLQGDSENSNVVFVEVDNGSFQVDEDCVEVIEEDGTHIQFV